MEPATPERADLRLTTWTGPGRRSDDEVLADVGYHGAGVRWLATTESGAARRAPSGAASPQPS
jgi:hypothetical protein